MTVITEAELREMWQGGRGTIAPLPRDVRFTPSARDFINQWKIEISYIDEVAPAVTPAEGTEENDVSQPTGDKPDESPVNPEGVASVCAVCGRVVSDEPAHTSQLNSGHDALKAAPRSLFRGKMDTLHAQFLLAINQARRFNLPDLVDDLVTLAAYCREITGAEYNEREVAPLQLAGSSETETHWPDHTPAQDQIVPGPEDHEMLLQLNLLHCQVRETELVATTVLGGPDSNLMQALNRLSRAVYELMLLFKAGKFAWKAPGWLEQTRESRA